MQSEPLLTLEMPCSAMAISTARTFVNTSLEKIAPSTASSRRCDPSPSTQGQQHSCDFLSARRSAEDQYPGQVALMRVVTRDYLPTIGARPARRALLRDIRPAWGSPVAIVNETFADRHFPGRSVIGNDSSTDSQRKGYWYTIVGVVKEIR